MPSWAQQLRRWLQGARRLVVGVALPVASSACAVATPRAEDAAAPRDFYAQLTARDRATPCTREMRVFDAGESIPEHDVLSTVSVTCSPGAIDICESRLKARACELHADALILDGSRAPGVPRGASSQSLVSRTGRAIRFR